MLHRPKLFLLLSLTFALISLSFPVQIMQLYDYSFQDLKLIINKISILNMFVITALVLNIPLLLRASPQLKLSLPMTLILVAWNNYVVGSYAHDYSMTTTSLSTFAFATLFAPLFSQKYRSLLQNPESRWWLRPKRVRASLHTQIHPYVGHRIAATSFDISESGVYIPFDDNFDGELKIGDMATLNIRLSQFSCMKCEAEVVRISESVNGIYPLGMGLRFIGLDPQMRNNLRGFIHKAQL